MTGRLKRAALTGALVAIVAGCTTTTPLVAEPGIVGADAPAPFPECQVDAFAFVGETSLAALDLEALGGGPDANRIGRVWVTAGPGRMDAGPGGPPPGGQRVICIEWPDGSGMSATIDGGWRPPGADVVETATSPAWPVIGAAVVVVLLLGVSFVAFRRE